MWYSIETELKASISFINKMRYEQINHNNIEIYVSSPSNCPLLMWPIPFVIPIHIVSRIIADHYCIKYSMTKTIVRPESVQPEIDVWICLDAQRYTYLNWIKYLWCGHINLHNVPVQYKFIIITKNATVTYACNLSSNIFFLYVFSLS